MKKRGLAAAAVCIALIGAVWAEWPEPAGDQVWAYQKLQPVDYRLLHSDARGFVTAKADEGFELHARHAQATSFEIRCKGVLVMDVENAPSRVLIRMPADALWRAPNIERLRSSCERWLDLRQSQGRLLVESAGPSWVEARFGRSTGLVPEEQRCLLGAPGHRQADASSGAASAPQGATRCSIIGGDANIMDGLH
ncbi:cold-shock protein [Stenotrophomonas maltophilia]|uniref:cold-shock protein n=1 Tax=Stenotrophomonas maltophilia TaxID=40324 RepID=UPI001F314800|nr:cold-shock protein [Stenotrophomonas maltophilia]